jgi:uncharacterized damage-inducible protein DinB
MTMPSLVEPILKEFRDEMPATRRLLERVPQEKLGWKPHAKSRSLGELAMHIANLPGMAEKIANAEEFAPTLPPPPAPSTIEEIRAAFEKNARSGEQALSGLNDDAAQKDWRLIFRGKEILRRPRVAALRVNMLNHLYHHRGQLSVYLRLLDVPVPVVYGPTADENPFA